MSIFGSLSTKFLTLSRGCNGLGVLSLPTAAWSSPSWMFTGSLFRPITTSPVLLAEPLKKKKRIDPAIVKAREARKLRKLEKEIRRLEKNARQLKPLDENQVPPSIHDNPRQRLRRLPQLHSDEVERRWRLELDMAKFKNNQVSREYRTMERLQQSQDKALNELRIVSEAFYEAAVAMDDSYLPYKSVGPVETPPLKGYRTPEGDYIDVSKDWDNNS